MACKPCSPASYMSSNEILLFLRLHKKALGKFRQPGTQSCGSKHSWKFGSVAAYTVERDITLDYLGVYKLFSRLSHIPFDHTSTYILQKTLHISRIENWLTCGDSSFSCSRDSLRRHFLACSRSTSCCVSDMGSSRCVTALWAPCCMLPPAHTALSFSNS